jgi:LmbE family N-acetylglucosaminyl deacetylase
MQSMDGIAKTPLRWIYLSPHFDDAVLSCGGLIWEQSSRGLPVEVWTICAGDAPPGPLAALALRCHREWGTGSAEETLALRRREDQEAARILGAAVRHFTTPDCIYRRSPEGDALYPVEIFIPLPAAEVNLDDKIATELAAELDADDVLVCPLTIGGHPDHVLTRGAAERLGRPLRYYADIPYLLDHPETLEPAVSGMKTELHPVSEAGLAAWQAGIAAYASQIPVLFGDADKMQVKISNFLSNCHGIRLWQA